MGEETRPQLSTICRGMVWPGLAGQCRAGLGMAGLGEAMCGKAWLNHCPLETEGRSLTMCGMMRGAH